MKRLFVLSLVFFLLCGCENPKTVIPIMQSISFTADVQYGDDNYQADANVRDDNLNLVVRRPEYIDGLTLNINKNGATASYKGISYPLDISSQPQGAMAQVLYNVLSDVSGKQLNCGEENCEINGKVDNYSYTFVFSPSGLPISLTVDEINLLVKFSNVSLN